MPNDEQDAFARHQQSVLRLIAGWQHVIMANQAKLIDVEAAAITLMTTACRQSIRGGNVVETQMMLTKFGDMLTSLSEATTVEAYDAIADEYGISPPLPLPKES